MADTSRTQRSIVIVDDKDHALKQVIFEFPHVSKNDLMFQHFDTIDAFRRAAVSRPFVVFLDFFLSKDRDYGSTLIPELVCEHLVCFSSRKEMSNHLQHLAQEQPAGRIAHVYSVQKLKNNLANQELKAVLATIFVSS